MLPNEDIKGKIVPQAVHAKLRSVCLKNRVTCKVPPVMQINATKAPCLPNNIKIVGLHEHSMAADKLVILLLNFKESTGANNRQSTDITNDKPPIA